MPEACSNGVRISYDDRGKGAPVLLFLPGWCVGREVFADLPRLAAARRRVLALDWRGHGDSQAAPASFGAEELVEDAIAVIEASGARSVVPVALSHAGWIAIELRRRLGDRIAKLVLIDWPVQEAPPPFLRVLEASQSPDRWSTAKLPVLHLYAQHDESAYLAAQQSFASSHPWYAVVKLAARSHFPMFEVPQQMSAEIERFVAPPQRSSLSAARSSAESWVNALPL